jgi:pimeloyl-ACP methyl ester carboxylesterase
MATRHSTTLALLGAGGAAGAAAALRRHRRRIAADPAHQQLFAPLHGERAQVTSADGTQLHAELFGPEDAPAIVLLHGWTETLRLLTLQIRELSKEFRVVAYDMRGHGRSGTAPDASAYSVDDHAADLDAVLRAFIPAGQRAVVAGHSLGAMTIVAWAGNNEAQVPERLAGAALISTGMGDLISESLVVRAPGRLERVGQVVGATLMGTKMPLPKGSTPVSHRIIRYIALSPEASPATVAFCERMILECRREVRGAVGATLSQLELNHAVESLSVPTIVIAGEHDRLTPPVHAQRLAESLPHLVELVEVRGIGHMAPVEAPDVVTAKIAQLARHRHAERPAAA